MAWLSHTYHTYFARRGILRSQHSYREALPAHHRTIATFLLFSVPLAVVTKECHIASVNYGKKITELEVCIIFRSVAIQAMANRYCVGQCQGCFWWATDPTQNYHRVRIP